VSIERKWLAQIWRSKMEKSTPGACIGLTHRLPLHLLRWGARPAVSSATRAARRRATSGQWRRKRTPEGTDWSLTGNGVGLRPGVRRVTKNGTPLFDERTRTSRCPRSVTTFARSSSFSIPKVGGTRRRNFHRLRSSTAFPSAGWPSVSARAPTTQPGAASASPFREPACQIGSSKLVTNPGQQQFPSQDEPWK
jgi:hypothetical protein